MRLFALTCLLGLTALACGAPEVTPFEPLGGQSATQGSEADKTDSSASTTPAPSRGTAAVVTPSTPTTPTSTTPPTQTPKPDTTWTGTLAKTTASAFGGAPYCNYATHFENVVVKLTLTADGAVKLADVTAKAVEATVGTCTQKPIAANAHDYPFTAEAGSESTTFQASGAAADEPHAMMTAAVTSAAPGHVTLTWHRDDIGAPFDWTITTDLTITQDE